ncbi:AraC family transcriptional regulator [Campylobacter sp. faydin G-105]|uniref:AraC family transcriptional regulator n=1 Tax=Campylobacter anatolicus TaxID=2829105 RepID=UPI001B9827F5|nr:AraC family transcriptional regulator [Campylobacter anatolicus]MBR8462756.1 AraC family transcriptional regulator [Campylobacter anatolicus]
MQFFNKKDSKFFIIISIVFLLFLGLNYYLNYNLLKDNIRRYETELFGRIHAKVEDWASSNFKDIEKIARLLQNENIADSSQIQPLLYKFQQSSNFPYLIMGLDDGNFYISDYDYVTPHNYDLKSRGWYNDTLKAGATIASNPYISMRLGLRSVSICTPIKLISKRGVFCGGQPFEFMRSYFKEYQTLYDKNLYLINSGGEILASFANLNETISFENITLPNEKYVAFTIKNTNWQLVFEKNQELYASELGKYLFINLLLYALCVLMYVLINLFWFNKSSASSKQLDEQKNYIKDILTKQVSGIFINCNESFDIISASVEFENFYDFKDADNLKNSINLSKFLTDDEKQGFVSELEISLTSSQIRYFNINIGINEPKKYIITTAPLSQNTPFAISVLFQDVSSMQEIYKTSNKLYNANVEKLLLFIKQNIDDDGLCIEKLAKVTGYSKFHIQRVFKNYMNDNISGYLRSYRLERAAFLLKFSDEKVSVIAKKCGFTHNETFIRSFSKTYNLAPIAYRQNLNILPQNQLVFEEIKQQPMRLAITHKFENLDFLKSKQKSNIKDIFIFLENGNIEHKIYATHSNDSELSYVEIPAGKWAKVDVGATNLSFDELMQKINEVFYDVNFYKFKPPFIYFLLTNSAAPEFIYIKI